MSFTFYSPVHLTGTGPYLFSQKAYLLVTDFTLALALPIRRDLKAWLEGNHSLRMERRRRRFNFRGFLTEGSGGGDEVDPGG